MPVALDDDVGHRVLLYGTDGVSLIKLATNASGQLVIVGVGSGGAQEVEQDTPADLQATVTPAAAAEFEAVQDTPDDLKVGPYGYISSAWQRQALIFGFSAQYIDQTINASGSAGTNNVDLSAVPANTLRVVTSITMIDRTTAASSLQLIQQVGGTSYSIRRIPGPAADTDLAWQGHLYLLEDDFIRGRFEGVTGGDRLEVHAEGYEMALNL